MIKKLEQRTLDFEKLGAVTFPRLERLNTVVTLQDLKCHWNDYTHYIPFTDNLQIPWSHSAMLVSICTSTSAYASSEVNVKWWQNHLLWLPKRGAASHKISYSESTNLTGMPTSCIDWLDLSRSESGKGLNFSLKLFSFLHSFRTLRRVKVAAIMPFIFPFIIV